MTVKTISPGKVYIAEPNNSDRFRRGVVGTVGTLYALNSALALQKNCSNIRQLWNEPRTEAIPSVTVDVSSSEVELKEQSSTGTTTSVAAEPEKILMPQKEDGSSTPKRVVAPLSNHKQMKVESIKAVGNLLGVIGGLLTARQALAPAWNKKK